jgi:hypothetical protein
MDLPYSFLTKNLESNTIGLIISYLVEIEMKMKF